MIGNWGSEIDDRPSPMPAPPRRWVGIDEAGYGPNLGPLVMTAVVAEGPAGREPDVWGDLAATVARAGSRDGRLWVDDSKRVYHAGQGLDRLEAATVALLDAAGHAVPATLVGLLAALGAGEPAGASPPCGLSHWWDGNDPPVPRPESLGMAESALALRPFAGAPWRIAAVRSVVIEPARFNASLEASGTKAAAHFAGFRTLLRWLWDRAADGAETCVRGDKHGGRHFYYDLLVGSFPDAWVDRGPEGPQRSGYTIRTAGRRLDLELCPRADAGDGLVALASLVSKAVRERWMGVFNAHWCARIPGLRPTAGYPGDAARFRAAIEPHCRARGLDPSLWWRAK
jgi:hypothetical protein